MRKSHYQFQVFLDLYSVAEQRQEQLIVPPETVALGLSTFSLVLSRLGKEQLDEKQISLNQFQTKAIVEYLHTLLELGLEACRPASTSWTRSVPPSTTLSEPSTTAPPTKTSSRSAPFSSGPSSPFTPAPTPSPFHWL